MPRIREPTPAAVQAGDILTCAETGQRFIADPTIPNFILKNYGRRRTQLEILSFAGLLARNLRDMKDHVGPFTVYLAHNGKTVTNRLGAKLGDVQEEKTTEAGRTHVRVLDSFGGWWAGRCSGRGTILNLRAIAPPPEVQSYIAEADRQATIRKAITTLENVAFSYGQNLAGLGRTEDNRQRWLSARRHLLELLDLPIRVGDT